MSGYIGLNFVFKSWIFCVAYCLVHCSVYLSNVTWKYHKNIQSFIVFCRNFVFQDLDIRKSLLATSCMLSICQKEICLKDICWRYSAIFCKAYWPVQCLSVRRDLKSWGEGRNFLCLEYHHPIIETQNSLYWKMGKYILLGMNEIIWKLNAAPSYVASGYKCVEIFI